MNVSVQMKAKGKTFYLLLYKGFLLFFRSLLKPYLHQRQLTTFPISVDKFAFLFFLFFVLCVTFEPAGNQSQASNNVTVVTFLYLLLHSLKLTTD